jgi:hypothetical protein
MDNYTEIKNKIRAMVGQKTPLLLTGKVKSVDGETCTVSIGDLTLTDVRLRSVTFIPFNPRSSKTQMASLKLSFPCASKVCSKRWYLSFNSIFYGFNVVLLKSFVFLQRGETNH